MRPDAFAVVMATGIVSVAASDHGWRVVAVVLAVVASIAMLVLICRIPLARRSWRFGDVDTPVGLLTFVAACCVLATRFDEFAILGGLAFVAWIALLPLIVRDFRVLRRGQLRDRAHGGWQLVSVSTSGLALVSVGAGFAWCGFVWWVFALLAYAVIAALVCWRAVGDAGMRRNVPPDHWILMGGLAIATLAGEHLHASLQPGQVAVVVRVVTVVTWIVATAQLVPLTVLGWRRARDWPAVFPLGMYSVATHAMSVELGWRALDTVSLAFLVAALALWLLTLLRFRRANPRSARVGAPKSPV